MNAESPSNPRHRRPRARRWWFALGTILLLLGLDTVAWWLLTSRLLAEEAAWRQARVAEGYTVSSGPPGRAGWPLRAVLVVPAVEVATTVPGSPNPVAWRTDRARLVYTPWRPWQVTVVLDGMQTVQWGAGAPIALRVQDLDLAIPLDQAGQANGVVATARHLQVPLPQGTLAVDALWLRSTPAEVAVSLSDLLLPGPSLPLGATIGLVELHARSTVGVPELHAPAAAATAWRDAGGQLLINDALLRWGPLDISGNASLALDATLQPVASGALRITGYGQAIDALARAGTLAPNSARVARTLLGLVSRTGADGVPQADVPLTLRDGTLSSGAFPLLKLPPLALP